MICFDFCHSLQVFQYLLYHALIGIYLLAGQRTGCLLQKTVCEQKQCKPAEQHQCDPPVKKQQHHNDQRSREQAFADHHDHACRDIFQILHHICSDRSDLSK